MKSTTTRKRGASTSRKAPASKSLDADGRRSGGRQASARAPRVGFIGAGAAASALAGAAARVNVGRVNVGRVNVGRVNVGRVNVGRVNVGRVNAVKLVGFYTRGSRSARAAARRAGGRAFDNLAELARDVDVLLVAVPDREIDAAARDLAAVARRGLVVAHLAGARGAEALVGAARRGADAGAFHPIQTIPGSTIDSRRVRGAFVAIEGNRAARAALRRLALTLGMVPFELPPTNRALYHASAVLASNAVVGLFDLAARAFAEATRLPRSKAEAALRPLLAATCQNLTKLPVPASLSGPVARGDSGTVRGHLAALAHGDRRAARAYAVLGEQALDIALRKGSLTPAGARALRRILGRPGS